MSQTILQPGQAFPIIHVDTLDGDKTLLGKPHKPFEWKMVVVYRGKHCPLCTSYLKTLNELTPAFNEQGVDVVAVSTDSKYRAEAQLADVNPRYPVGYGLTLKQARQLGLFISDARSGMNVETPFAEPGLFVINDKGAVQMLDLSNVPFARPDLNAMLSGIRFIRGLEGKFPINGSYQGDLINSQSISEA